MSCDKKIKLRDNKSNPKLEIKPNVGVTLLYMRIVLFSLSRHFNRYKCFNYNYVTFINIYVPSWLEKMLTMNHV